MSSMGLNFINFKVIPDFSLDTCTLGLTIKKAYTPFGHHEKSYKYFIELD